MKQIIVVLSLAFLSLPILAQPYGRAYGQRHKERSEQRRTNCTTPFPEQAFMRDYAGLVRISPQFLVRELNNYTRFKCLTADQVRRLALLLRIETDQYNFLVSAYNSVFDVDNYAAAGDVLTNPNVRRRFYRFMMDNGIPVGNRYDDCRDYDRYDRRYDGDYRPQTRVIVQIDFEREMANLRRITFENDRVRAFEQLMTRYVFTSQQIAELLRLFSFDSNRLTCAQQAYGPCYDKENYGYVAQTLTFDSNRRNLERYIAQQRR